MMRGAKVDRRYENAAADPGLRPIIRDFQMARLELLDIDRFENILYSSVSVRSSAAVHFRTSR